MKKATLKLLSFFLVTAILIYTLSVTAIALEDTTEDTIEKVYCEATLEDDFTDNDILLVMTPENNFREYTVNDFSNIGCIEIEDLSIDPEEGKLCRILHLTLDTHSKQNVLDSIKILEERDDIYSAEPNYLDSIDSTPDDSEYLNTNQWYLNQINLLNAWYFETGTDSVWVGVIDSGIDASHPDLVNRVNTTISKSFVDHYPSATSGIVHDHGTHVAGIIGAEPNNEIGISGICWNVELISLRVDLAPNPNDTSGLVYFDGAALVEAVKYAQSWDIDILNYSGGSSSNSVYMQAMAVQIQNYNGLFVCAAGNNYNNTDIIPNYPSVNNFSNLISVGASTADDRKADFSNYGKTTVDIFAPGVNIRSTVSNNGYANWNGTSMATPIVAGVAALILSLHPELTAAEIKNIILSSVDIIYDSNGNNVFGDLCVSGGRINAYKALTNDTAHNYYVSNSDYMDGHIYSCVDCGHQKHEDHTYTYKSISAQQHIVGCQHCSYEYLALHLVNPNTGKCKFCGYNTSNVGTLSTDNNPE